MRDTRYKKDSLVQAWIDRRSLATIINWMYRRGESPFNLSEVLRFAIDHLTKVATSGEDGVKFVEFTEDADIVIRNSMRVKLNRGGKGIRNLTDNLAVDRARIAIMDGIDERSKAAVEAELQMSGTDTEIEMSNVDTESDLLRQKAQLIFDTGKVPSLEAAINIVKEHEKLTRETEKIEEAREDIGETEKVE